MCLVCPHGWSLLPSNCTLHINLCFWHVHVVHHTCLSIPEKPGSATRSSTSTTSTGLQCLSVGAQVHLVCLELQVIACDRCHKPMCSAHHNYWHSWVGANWSCTARDMSLSPPRVTQVFKCSCRKVSREHHPLTPMGLPVVWDIDMQLAWCVSCLQPLGKDVLG